MKNLDKDLKEIKEKLDKLMEKEKREVDLSKIDELNTRELR